MSVPVRLSVRHLLTLAAVPALLLASTASAGGLRSVQQTVISAENPRARISVDPSYQYLGHTQAQVMNDTATAEQHWFGQVRNGRLIRAVVVHFEALNDGAKGAFNYPSFRLQRLGAHDYLHQSFPMKSCTLITAEVGPLLDRVGAEASGGCLVTRFVRAVDEAKRREIILFYVELADDVDDAPAGLAPGGLPVGYDQTPIPDTPWLRVDRRLTAEALAVISVMD